MDIDFNTKLQITIKNQKPVVLTDLTLSLLAINQQFQRFIESETNQDYDASSELYIKEVRTGSIIVELVTQTLPILPLVWTGGSLAEWVTQAQGIINWLLNKSADKPKDLSKKDYQQWQSILSPIAKDNGSQLNFTVSDGGQVINQFFINSTDAEKAQLSINNKLRELEEPNDHIQRKKVMVWYQTKFDRESHTGDKVVIEAISKKPVKVVFENNSVKEKMLKGDSRFDKPWHELAYLVDIEIQTINDVPKLYTILRYFEDDTFDPNE